MVGKKQVRATLEEVEEGLNGGCTSCGEIQYGGCEPDACNYECENCGEKTVFGLAELAIMGQLVLTEDEADSDEEATAHPFDGAGGDGEDE